MKSLLLTAIICLLSLVCASSIQAKDSLGDQQTFKLALSYFPKNLNVLTGIDMNSFRRVVLFDSLVTINPENLEYTPYLAEKFDFDSKRKVISFHLRKGVRFHDGHEMDAEDIAYSFEQLTQTPLRAGLNPEAKNISHYKIINPHEIEFHLKKASFTTKELLYFMFIFPKHVYAKLKTEKDANKFKKIIGSGPYRLKKFIRNKSILLERHKEWWGYKLFQDRYQFERLLYKNISDTNIQLQLFNRKELDYVALTPDLFRKKESLHVDKKRGKFLDVKLKYAGTGITLWLNTERPEFATIKSRKAFIHLINRQFINQKFYNNKAVISAGPWSSDRPYADSNIKPLAYDPQMAIQLLQAEGWQLDQEKKLFFKNLKTKDGLKKHYYEVAVQLPSQMFEKHFGIIQSDLKKYGISLSIKQIDWNSLLKLFEDGNYDMGLTSRNSGINTYFPMFNFHSKQNKLKKGDWNLANYNNPQVDKLIDQLEMQWKISERNKLLKKIFKLIAEEYPAVFLFDYISANYLVRKDLQTPMKEDSFIPAYHFWHY